MSGRIVLRLNVSFRLPDGFKGGLAAALRDLATYVEAPCETKLPPHTTCFSADPAAFSHNCSLGLRFAGETGIFKLEDGRPWQELPQRRGGYFGAPDNQRRWVK